MSNNRANCPPPSYLVKPVKQETLEEKLASEIPIEPILVGEEGLVRKIELLDQLGRLFNKQAKEILVTWGHEPADEEE